MTYSVLSCHKPSKSWALDFVSVNTQIALILCRLCYWLSSVKAHVSTISLSLGGTDRWFSGKTVSGKLWKHSDCGCVCPLQAGSSPHCAWHEDVLKRFYSPEHCASLWETAMLCFFLFFFYRDTICWRIFEHVQLEPVWLFMKLNAEAFISKSWLRHRSFTSCITFTILDYAIAVGICHANYVIGLYKRVGTICLKIVCYYIIMHNCTKWDCETQLRLPLCGRRPWTATYGNLS